MNTFYTFILLAVTFFLGAVVGEAWAPISGITTQALAARCAALETRTEALAERYERLKAMALDLRRDCHLDAGRQGRR